MFFVLDPDGVLYVDGQTHSGDALDRAVKKHSPNLRSGKYTMYQRRQAWDHMRGIGYTIIERQLDRQPGNSPGGQS